MRQVSDSVAPSTRSAARIRTILAKKAVEFARDDLEPELVFYYADEFNISRHPTLRAMWGPKGHQVMIPSPMQPTRRYGPGAIIWHSGETLVLIRHPKRQREVAELLEGIPAKHPTETVYVAFDKASTHEDGEVDAVLRNCRRRPRMEQRLYFVLRRLRGSCPTCQSLLRNTFTSAVSQTARFVIEG